MLTVRYTLWSSLYDLENYTPVEETWGAVVARFRRHIRTTVKDQVPGFGPYLLRAPRSSCYDHRDGLPRDQPHRCDSCVEEMTMLVSDVDEGTQADVDACEGLLAEAGVARIWYSSFSYPAKPSYRLIVPLSEPVAPTMWRTFRQMFMGKFQIPANPKKCSGRSHFYFLPSCPPDVTPYFAAPEGRPFPVRTLISSPKPYDPRESVSIPDFEPPPEPPGPVDLAPIVEELRNKQTRLLRNSATKEKGELLRRCLDGQALAPHGSRDNSALIVAGILAWALPGTPVSVLKHLMRRSVDAMIADGSSLTWPKVERMLLTAMRNKYEADQRNTDILDALLSKVRKLEEEAP